MKNSKTLLIVALVANFNGIYAETLPKVQIFQQFAKACPRTLDAYTSGLKGIAAFSSEPADVKDCAKSLAQFIEESQTITTEDAAQVFATNLINKMTECQTVASREAIKIANNNKKLPYVKVAQQIMIAFPHETQAILGVLAMQAINSSASQRDKEISEHALVLIPELQQVKTEAQAEIFSNKLLLIAKKYKD